MQIAELMRDLACAPNLPVYVFDDDPIPVSAVTIRENRSVELSSGDVPLLAKQIIKILCDSDTGARVTVDDTRIASVDILEDRIDLDAWINSNDC